MMQPYGIKLLGRWINLSLIREIQIESDPPTVVVVIWHGGDKTVFRGFNAIAILEAVEALSAINESLPSPPDEPV